MIDWKRKLTSRKFWMALVAFITPLLLAFGVAENDAAQVTAIIMAGADVMAYILAEGMVDAKNAAAAPENAAKKILSARILLFSTQSAIISASAL